MLGDADPWRDADRDPYACVAGGEHDLERIRAVEWRDRVHHTVVRACRRDGCTYRSWTTERATATLDMYADAAGGGTR